MRRPEAEEEEAAPEQVTLNDPVEDVEACADSTYGRWDVCFVLAAPDWHRDGDADAEDGGVARTAHAGDTASLVERADGATAGALQHRPKASLTLDDLLLRLTASGLDHYCYRSVQGDEIYVKVRASLGRLEQHAEATRARFRLHAGVVERRARRGFPRQGIQPIIIGEECRGVRMARWRPYEHLYAKYDRAPDLAGIYDVPRSEQDTAWPFSSMQRVKLIWDLLHAKRSDGGCELDVATLTYHGDVLAFLALHDAVERHELHREFCYHSAGRSPLELPLDRYAAYFGEMHGLRMYFTAHVTTWYYPLSIAGLAVFLERRIKQEMSTHGVIGYSAVLVVWSILAVEYWGHRQAVISVLWGTRGFEEREKARPQHRGYLARSPVDGRDEIWYPPRERRYKVWASTAIVFLMVVANLLFLYLVFWCKAEQPGALKFVAHQHFVLATAVVNSIGIQVFKLAFTHVAEWCTNRENWRTETEHHDAFTQKLFYFFLVNYYVPLFYLTFIQYYANPWVSQSEARGCTGNNAGGGKDPLDGAAANPCDDTVASQVLKEVWTSLAIILSTALSGSFVGRLIAPLVQETLRKKKEGGISVAMSVPELQYILMEYDELKHTTVDYMQTTIQYGYIVLLSAAFPLGPFVALLVNNVQVRTDCYAFIHLYRRVMPSSAEDIGVFEKFFQMLNVAGVVTNAALSVYVSKPFSENKGWSDHNRHNLFIVVVTVGLSFYASCRLLLDAVPPSVEIQVKRQEFIESKIVDREKDFDVHEDLKVASIDYRVHAMDDGAYHTNMLMFDEEDHAPPRTSPSAVED